MAARAKTLRRGIRLRRTLSASRKGIRLRRTLSASRRGVSASGEHSPHRVGASALGEHSPHRVGAYCIRPLVAKQRLATKAVCRFVNSPGVSASGEYALLTKPSFELRSKLKYQSKTNHYRCLIAIILLSCACANIQRPSGGPEDKSLPEIVNVKPTSGSINVPLDSDIELEFSKPMNMMKTEKALFISPLFFNFPEYKWSGRKLKIKLPDKLMANTTYVLTVGASVCDKRGNELGQTFSYPFSTGMTIYSCSISGKVLISGRRNLNIWAYKLESSQPDTFWMKLPDYITQPDSLGDFKFEYLSYGTYLVAAVEDKNNDQFWAPPAEKLALPDTLITLNETNPEYGPLIMMTVDRDTLQPKMTRVVSPNKNMFIVEFSQRMDSSSIFNIDNYILHPVSDSSAIITIKDIYPVTDDLMSMYIECGELIEGEKYKFNASRLNSVYDIISDTLSRIFSAGGIDTTAPLITAIDPRPSNRPIPIGFDITVYFSEPMDSSGIVSSISIADTIGAPVSFEAEWIYPHKIEIKPDFETDKVYNLFVDEQNIYDKSGNPLGDTIISYIYNIASLDTFGQVIGRVVNAPGLEIVVIAEPKTGKESAVNCNNDGFFKFDRLFPGVYNLRAFYDSNKNENFNGGEIRPFKFAESIALYGDTVKVRSRWETDIGIIDFKPQIK
ncbi:MAG: Ig-like domain-containing protein [candidate division Zixibacteria bacterium]|nr:Ig-like domain-containing protein [candidate division Zixibacteria bacterium]